MALLLLAAPLCASGAEVISHEQLTLSLAEIREVFLGEIQVVDGVRLVPVDNRTAQGEFLAKILQTDPPKYYARWTHKSFRQGINTPAMKGSNDEVVAFVKATRGAIGYIRGQAKGVFVLQTF